MAVWIRRPRSALMEYGCDSCMVCSSTVRALRTMTVPFQVVLWCYIAVLTFLALLCEAPYDYARSGQWWDYSSQNPLWAVIIALVTCSVWNIESDSMPSTVIVRLVLVIVAVVWSFAFQVLLSIVLLLCFFWCGQLTRSSHGNL